MKMYVARTDTGYIKSWTEYHEESELKLGVTVTEDITRACQFTQNTIGSLLSTTLDWGLGHDFFELISITEV